MLSLAISWLSGCSSEPAPSASEEKLTAADTKAALERKSYQGTPGPNNTENPTEGGRIVQPIDEKIPANAQYPDFEEHKSGFTRETTYSTSGLSNDTYAISQVKVSDYKYFHSIQNRTWTLYVEPAPQTPYYPPSNPDNDEWNTPSTPYTPPAQNPDNDDWSSPSQPYTPPAQNPDNDDWSGSLFNLGLLGSSPAEAAPSGFDLAVLALTCPSFEYYQIGSTNYMKCGNTTYMEYVTTPTYDDIRKSSVSVDFSVKGSGGTTTCNLTAPSRLKGNNWVYDPGNVVLNCDADWAETKTNEKGKPVSAARTYANDLSQLIQGTAPVAR